MGIGNMVSLNQEQRNAFQDVLAFINNKTQKYYRVSGGAGTGKSFFIAKVADGILKHKNSDVNLFHVGITATTNKAAAVLADAMPHNRGDITTIYSFMNLRVSDNYKTGEQNVIPTRNWAVHDKTLIIIDEASMVNKSLMEYIEKGTTKDCKILFVGDKNQLAPVKENLSPVYSQPISESLLLKPVRNAEQPALMELCEQAVEAVLTDKFFKIKEVPGVIDFINGIQLQGLLEREYNTEDPTKRVLCYTNNRVIQYNEYIKQIRGYTSAYNVGEIMTNNASAELNVSKLRLYADQMVEITSVGKTFKDSVLVPGHEVELVYLDVKDVHTGAEYSLTVFADPADRGLVLKHFSSNKKWDRYFRTKSSYPDLRSIAASTTHKAQGSTYESVIVDLTDIGKSTNREQTARMQYVALSRARSRLYIRGKLPERYFA